MKHDPRIDAYIAKAQPFARPILLKVRERVHALVPGVEEMIKWGHPSYLKHGKIVVGTAAFSKHASVRFWRGHEFGLVMKDAAIGQLGKLRDINDLPYDLDAIIERAAKHASERAPRAPSLPKPMPDIHPDFASALAKAPRTKAIFDAFAPSQQREYVDWINEAKQDRTRKERIAKAIDWIGEGKRRNWKYEKR